MHSKINNLIYGATQKLGSSIRADRDIAVNCLLEIQKIVAKDGESMIKTYLVGGAVRDGVLGHDINDRDYVVVNATTEYMISKGFEQVGSSFPVFLHPETKEEHALARTEKKTGHGHTGFEVYFDTGVTLEQDLARRDLTINAMAVDDEGNLIDPYGGMQHIEKKLLSPVSVDAFKEDPLRVLRAARFLAQLPDFSPSQLLEVTCINMAEKGMLKELTPERVWKETEKALAAKKPSRYFEFLKGMGVFHEIDALEAVEQDVKWHPEGNAWIHTMMTIDAAADAGKRTSVIWGVLCHDLGKPVTYAENGNLHGHEEAGVPVVNELCERLKVPSVYCKIAVMGCKYHTHIHRAFELRPKTIQKLFSPLSALKLERLLDIAEMDKRGRGEPVGSSPYPQREYIEKCWIAKTLIDRDSITRSMDPGPAVGEAIRIAEIGAIKQVDKSSYK